MHPAKNMTFMRTRRLIIPMALINLLLWPLASYSFEYSKELIALGAASSSTKASTYYDLFSCQLPECVEIKTKLDKVEEDIKLYDTKLYQLIINIDDPEIIKLEKNTTKLQTELNNPLNLNIRGDIKNNLSKARVELVESAGKINPEINDLSNKISHSIEQKLILESELIDAALAKSREELYDNMYNDGYDDEDININP